ncbi:MAG: phosphonate ABC transporter, permease protein PhnE [Rhizobiales bacterium]|nr:phosphonate ABC transporter, permease protein PhnE [Hyphomicrobiales bacterium]
MSTSTEIAPAREARPEWSRFRHPRSTLRFGGLLVALALLGYSIVFLNIDLERLLGAFPRLAEILATRYVPPDIDYISQAEFLRSVLRTLEMSLLGGVAGVLISIPLAWMAATNITISRRVLYPLGRLAIMGSRSIHETIWTILFVTMFGFGMLAGTLALTVFCIGFAGKLFADELEAIDMGPVEALRAVGASPLQVFQYAVLPQVRVAFTGIAIYTWDVAFRAATVVGFFGGGGMGWYLKRTTQQLESTRVAAILLTIIILVLLAEIGSGWLRRKVHTMR